LAGQAAAHPHAALGEDLQGRHRRIDAPSLNETREPRSLPLADRQQHRIGADGQDHRVACVVNQTAQELGRLNAFTDPALKQAKG
jgi:hypothetical protein